MIFDRLRIAVCLFAFSCAAIANPAALLPGGRVLEAKLHHLGTKQVDFGLDVSKLPDGKRLEISFKAEKNFQEHTLAITIQDLNAPATVRVNGKKIKGPTPSLNRTMVYLIVPKKALKDGSNVLSFIPEPGDDCVIGNVVLYPKPYLELLQLERVALSVIDSDTGKAIPSRVTITDSADRLQPIFDAPTNCTAVRLGLIYTRGTETMIHIRKGDYVFYATRGTEWSQARQTVTVIPGEVTRVQLQIRRELDTRGFIAADTHIHNLTFSGHGDATIHERMITLAGEGIELAVATDHNHHTDYRPYQKQLSLNTFFTPVVGNEISTRVGHFNAFPMSPQVEPPPFHQQTNWVKIVESARMRGAKVVILNHPRWKPLPVWQNNGLNTVTGERANGMPITFDGMELVNSGNVQGDIMGLFQDWFALLNRGKKVTSVGGSDSHGVYATVGQGRTYIRSSTDVADRIKVDEICTNFLAGESSVSFGIYSEVLVQDRFSMGQLVPVTGSTVKVQMRVAAPSWVSPRWAIVFLNGKPIVEKPVQPCPGQRLDTKIEFSVPAPQHDAYLVCAVLGDRLSSPGWPSAFPYTLAACNPVYLDRDNNGSYESPRTTAARLVAQTNGLDKQWRVISEVDDAIAAQMVDIMLHNSDAMSREAIVQRMKQGVATRTLWADFLQQMK